MANTQPRFRKKLVGAWPSLRNLLIVWFLTLILPFLAIKLMLNHLEFSHRDIQRQHLTAELHEELGYFAEDCTIKALIRNRLNSIENAAGLPENSSSRLLPNNLSKKIPGLAARLKLEFKRKFGTAPVLLICSNYDSSETEILTDRRDWFARPGQRAGKALIKALIEDKNLSLTKGKSTKSSINEVNVRLLNNFVNSVNGNYFSLLQQEDEIEEAFINKGQGEKIFSIKRFIYSSEKKCLFAYYAIIDESAVDLKKLLKFSLASQGEKSIQRSFAILPAHSRSLVSEKEGHLQALAPMPYSLLRLGSHRSKDILRRFFKAGKMQSKPGVFPFLRVTKKIEAGSVGRFNRLFSVLAIFLCFLSLPLLQSIASQTMLRMDIRSKLTIALFSAIFLQASFFFYSAIKYSSMQQQLQEREQLTKMQHELKLLELEMKSEDDFRAGQLEKTIGRFSLIIDKGEIRQAFMRLKENSTTGLALVRNDGFLLETIDESAMENGALSAKFQLSRQIAFATILKYLQLANVDCDQLITKFKGMNGGKQIISIADFLSPIDIDNFSSYEGQPYSTNKEEGDYRFRIFRFKSAADGKELVNHLIVIENVSKIVAEIINKSQGSWNNFFSRTDNGLLKTRLFGSFDLNSARLNPELIWPDRQPLLRQEQQVLSAITSGASELSKVFSQTREFSLAVAARKISGYPLIALSSLELNPARVKSEQTMLLLTASVLYFIAIVFLVTSILSRLFLAPIDALMRAGQELEKGQSLRIENEFNNELSAVTEEFNRMVKGFNERNLLERFMSQEAVANIEEESRNLTFKQSEKVTRTILFCHIKSFNDLCRQLEPAQLLEMLNQYFSIMETEIKKNQGQIDKYIGDAIMAVFSTRESSAKQAVMAGLAMIRKIETEIFTSRAIKLEIGIGIATGTVIVGKIGAKSGRQDFTAIGDRVNFSARLEALAHQISGSAILIDARTNENITGEFVSEFFGEIKVKGKTVEEKVFKLVADER